MALSFKDHKLSEAEMTWLKAICQDSEFDPNRADEIEHQDRITDLILSEIERCEMVIADLSYERPNVYYEIGYAHALKRRPILYRKTGTKLHFDLSVHNVPEYKNLTELRSLLLKRLEAVLGRSPASG
jgi:nucleoside 2-deoxyribosyltransferase